MSLSVVVKHQFVEGIQGCWRIYVAGLINQKIGGDLTMMSVVQDSPACQPKRHPCRTATPPSAPAEKAGDNLSRTRPRLSHKTLYKQSLAEPYTSFKMPLGINNPLPSSMRSAHYLHSAIFAVTLLTGA